MRGANVAQLPRFASDRQQRERPAAAASSSSGQQQQQRPAAAASSSGSSRPPLPAPVLARTSLIVGLKASDVFLAFAAFRLVRNLIGLTTALAGELPVEPFAFDLFGDRPGVEDMLGRIGRSRLLPLHGVRRCAPQTLNGVGPPKLS